MHLDEFLTSERALHLEGAVDRDEALRAVVARAVEAIPGVGADDLLDAILSREGQTPTSTPEGVAFPHALLPGLERTVVVAALVPKGVDFGVEGHPPSDLLFAMFGAEERPWAHIQLLARLSRIACGEGALDRLRRCSSGDELYEALMDEDRGHV